jgi:hypothetical protein
MKIPGLVVLSAILVASGFVAEPESRFHFRANGFSIAPLEGVSENVPYQAVMMFLPVTEAFAPNVNVQIQPYDGTIKDFASLSQQQFKACGFTVLSENVSSTTVVWEYSGTFQGHRLHWYARAVQNKNKVYLVTATATESQWKTVSTKLRACVDSFKIEKGEQRPQRAK